MKLLSIQFNPIVGDIKGNGQRIRSGIKRGVEGGADLILFPELALTGYPPEDLLLLPDFIEAVEHEMEEIAAVSKGAVVVVGLPRKSCCKTEKPLFNSAAIFVDGTLHGYADKQLLPTYDVFDERRYFEPGKGTTIHEFQGKRIAITICEDLWGYGCSLLDVQYARDPVLELKAAQPDLVLNLSASPYHVLKLEKRLAVFKEVADALQCPLLLCNQVGANDSLIFDGNSFFITAHGKGRVAKAFQEDDFWVDLQDAGDVMARKREPIADVYAALVLGLRDYFFKQGFEKACLGLSGGVDSAVVACIACAALGADKVLALYMPSDYSSLESERDARVLAQRLKIELTQIAIQKPFYSYMEILGPHFSNVPPGITEENIQARIRGMLLMAFSNKKGHLVLATGNKSELAMGYSTLYGDMCGGISVIGDVLKGQVYALAEWMNREQELIPTYTILRPPSAELRPNQRDEDTLPPYCILDAILQAYLQERKTAAAIVKEYGYAQELVAHVIDCVHRNEYKRRQAPPVLRVSEKAFSVGRRFPIVHKWKGF